MAQFRDFPDIEIPDWAVTLGFTDRSWGNDAAARMERPWYHGTVLMLWVSDKDPAQREQPDYPRFDLVIFSDDNLQWCAVYATENEQKMREFLQLMIQTTEGLDNARE